MNKIYRVIFNKALNVFQAVSEITSGHKKNSISHINRPCGSIISILKWSLISCSISNAIAGNTNVVPGSTTTVITSDSTGITYVNIAAANNGISHNKYTDFNVNKPGMVFNNSATDGNSVLGKEMQGNKNLAISGSAHVILNEVQGINRTDLNGPMEVFGQKAGVVIVNPNGITVNGGSTINMKNLTLSTGMTSINNDNIIMDVSRGDVTISSDGMNTTGLDYFDAIAKSIKIQGTVASLKKNGELSGDTEIKFIAGDNAYSYKDRTYKAKQNDSKSTEIGIDGGLAGSLYGSYVTLIATDSGAGVRHKGIINTANDITINSNGDISIDSEDDSPKINAKNLNANASGSIALANMDISNDIETSVSVDAKTKITKSEIANLTINKKINSSNGNIELRDVKVKSDINASGKDIAIDNSEVSNDIIISSVGNLSITDLNVGKNAELSAKKELIINKSKNTTEKNALTLKVGNKLTINKNLDDGNVNFLGNTEVNSTEITAKNINFDNALLDITGKEKNTIDVINNFNLKGESIGQTEVTPGVWEKIENTYAVKEKGEVKLYRNIYENGELIRVDSLGKEFTSSSNSGVNAFHSDVIINAEKINNDKGVIQSDNLNITLNQMNNDGSIYAKRYNLTANEINNDFIMQSDEDFNIKTNNLNSTSSIISSKGELNIATNTFENRGVIEGAGKLVITDLEGNKEAKDSQLTINAYGDYSNTDGNYSSFKAGTSGLDITVNQLNNSGNFTISENKGIESYIRANRYIGSGSDSNFRSASTGGVIFDTDEFIMRDGAKYSSTTVTSQKTTIKGNHIRIENPDFDFENLTNAYLNNYNRNSTTLTGNGFNFDAKEDFYNAGIINTSGQLRIVAENFINDQTGRIIGVGAKNPTLLITSSKEYNGSDDSTKSYTGIFENYGTISTSGNNVDIAFAKIHNVRPEQWNGLTDSIKTMLTRLNFFAGITSSNELTLIAQSEVKNYGNIYSPNYLKFKIKDKDAILENKNIDGRSGIYSENVLDWIMQVFNIKTYNNKEDDEVNDIYISPNAKNEVNMFGDILEIDKDAIFQTTSKTNIYINEFKNKGGMWFALGGINFGEIDILDGINVIHKALTNFVNEAGSYIFSPDAIFIKVDGNISNNGVIHSDRDMFLDSKELSNGPEGLIQSNSELNIYADKIENLARLTGEVQMKDYQHTNGKWEKDNGTWVGNDVFNLYGFDFLKGFDISSLHTQQGQIISNGNIIVETGKASNGNGLLNQGIIYAKNLLQITGDVENTSLNQSIELMNLIKNPSLINNNRIYVNIHRNGLSVDSDRNFSSLYELLNFALNPNSASNVGYDSSIANYQSQYMILAIVDAANKNVFLKQLLSNLLGSDFSSLAGNHDFDTLRSRWSSAHNSKNILRVYPEGQTVMGGGKVDFHGAFFNGENVSNSHDDLKIDNVDVKIGDVNTTTIQGQLDSLKNTELPDTKTEIDKIGSSAMFRPGSTSNSINIIINTGKPSQNSSGKVSSYNEATESDRGLTIHYLYETRVDLINQNDYYGSASFLENVKFDNIGVTDFYTSGDNYFETTLILDVYKKMKGSSFILENKSLDASLVNELIMNASDFMQNFSSADPTVAMPEFGKPLTPEQQALLSKDIVWYVFEEIDGKNVLSPQIYLSSTSENLKVDLEASGGASIVSSGNVNIISDDENININNGSVIGQNVNLESTGGNINIINNDGLSDGVIAVNEVNMKGNNITIQGSGAAGKNISVEADDNVTLVASMGYDKDGSLKNRHENQLIADNNINITADKIKTEGADIHSGNNITLKANDITLNDVKEVSSSLEQTVQKGKGVKNIHDIAKGKAESSGTQISTSSLNIETGNDLVITGGSIDADNSVINVQNDFITKAGETFESERENKSSYGFWMGASAGAYGSSVSTGSGATRVDLEPNESNDMNAKSGSNGLASNMITGNPSGANAGFGFSYSKSDTRTQSKTHTNADLNLGNADITVGKTMDIGGGDFNKKFSEGGNDVPTLNISAENINSTKFVDETKTTTDSSHFSMGVTTNANSNLAQLGTVSAGIDSKDMDAHQIGMLAAAAIADVTQLLNGNASASAGISLGGGKGHSETSITSENRNIIGGNVNFSSNKDIVLNNVEMKGGDEISLYADKGNVEINAGKTTTHTETYQKDWNASITVDGSASYEVAILNPTSSSAGASSSVTAQAGYNKTTTSNDTLKHTNSELNAKNISIKTGGDLNLNSSNIDADKKVNIDVAGNINITSKQDITIDSSETNGGGANLGLSMGTHGSTFTGGGNYNHAESNTDQAKVEKQAGISSKDEVNINTGGDLTLTGGNIISERGNVDVGGDLIVNEIKDHTKQDGYSIGVGLSFDPTEGGTPVTPDLSFSQAERKDYQATNHGTIDIGTGNVNASGNISDNLNTEREKAHTVEKDKEYGEVGGSVTIVNLSTKSTPTSTSDTPEPISSNTPPVVTGNTPPVVTGNDKKVITEKNTVIDQKITAKPKPEPEPTPAPPKPKGDKANPIYSAQTEVKKANDNLNKAFGSNDTKVIKNTNGGIKDIVFKDKRIKTDINIPLSDGTFQKFDVKNLAELKYAVDKFNSNSAGDSSHINYTNPNAGGDISSSVAGISYRDNKQMQDGFIKLTIVGDTPVLTFMKDVHYTKEQLNTLNNIRQLTPDEVSNFEKGSKTHQQYTNDNIKNWKTNGEKTSPEIKTPAAPSNDLLRNTAPLDRAAPDLPDVIYNNGVIDKNLNQTAPLPNINRDSNIINDSPRDSQHADTNPTVNDGVNDSNNRNRSEFKGVIPGDNNFSNPLHETRNEQTTKPKNNDLGTGQTNITKNVTSKVEADGTTTWETKIDKNKTLEKTVTDAEASQYRDEFKHEPTETDRKTMEDNNYTYEVITTKDKTTTTRVESVETQETEQQNSSGSGNENIPPVPTSEGNM